MLHALASDLANQGMHVLAPCDPRLPSQDASFDRIPVDASRPMLDSWIDVASKSQAAIVIAPEIDHQLLKCVEVLRASNIQVIASDSSFLANTSDKFETYLSWLRDGVPTPATQLASRILDGESLSQSIGPYVLKHRLGAGCFGTRVIDDDRSLYSQLGRLQKPEEWIVQPWIEGDAGSISMIVDGEIRWSGIAGQIMERQSDRIHYAGFEIPWVRMDGQKIVASQIEELGSKGLAAIKGEPMGWIGVDFLLPANGDPPIAIEINPRLTTSYLGHRQHRSDLALILIHRYMSAEFESR